MAEPRNHEPMGERSPEQENRDYRKTPKNPDVDAMREAMGKMAAKVNTKNDSNSRTHINPKPS